MTAKELYLRLQGDCLTNHEKAFKEANTQRIKVSKKRKVKQ